MDNTGEALHQLSVIGACNAALFGCVNLADIKRHALDLVRDAIGADGCLIIISSEDRAGDRITHHFSDIEPSGGGIQHFRISHFLDDPVFRALTCNMGERRHAAVDMQTLPDIESFRQSETYHQVYEVHGMRQVLSAIAAPGDSAIVTIAFYRSDITRRFSASDLALIAALAPAVGETVRRMSLVEALVGRLGVEPVVSDLTLRLPGHEPGVHQLVESMKLEKRPLYVRRPALDDEVADADGRIALLSPREREIALLASRGLTNAQIADQAGISRKTVEIHISAVLRKLELNNRTELTYLIQALNARGHQLRATLETQLATSEHRRG